jgi:nucleoid DNA-binding protein
MQSLITSYLLQSKECALPGLGVLKIIHTPASTDAANNKLLPPFEQVIFKNEAGGPSAGLIKYIADKKQVDPKEAEDRLENFCSEWKEKINAGEPLIFVTLGSLQKDTDGRITFNRDKANYFLAPVTIDKTYRREERAEQTMEKDAGVEEPVTVEEASYNEEVIVERSYWGLWALILLAIGLVMLFYHFKDRPLTGSSMGNQQPLRADTATATYFK